MRDNERIGPILWRLARVWKNFPQMRLTQLIINVLGPDPYYVEDERMIDEIEEYYKKE